MRTIYRNGMKPKLFVSLRILLLHNGHFSGRENEKIFAPQCCTQRMPGSDNIVALLYENFPLYNFVIRTVDLCRRMSNGLLGIANYTLIEPLRDTTAAVTDEETFVELGTETNFSRYIRTIYHNSHYTNGLTNGCNDNPRVWLPTRTVIKGISNFNPIFPTYKVWIRHLTCGNENWFFKLM